MNVFHQLDFRLLFCQNGKNVPGFHLSLSIKVRRMVMVNEQQVLALLLVMEKNIHLGQQCLFPKQRQ